MITDETKRQILETIEKIEALLDPVWLKEHEDAVKALESKTLNPDFWKSPDSKETLKLLSMTKKEIAKFKQLETVKNDLNTLLELYEEAEEHLDKEAQEVLFDANKLVKEFEIERFLSEPYDDLNAFVSFSSGAGGVDAQDWTEMLLKMYLRFFEKKGFEAKIIDQTVGEEAGIKSATVYVKGEFAYGLLKGESGVHRLVRISPFDANRRRHTSFALVEVVPDLGEVEDIEIDEKDLKIEIFRASGHGGQNVQKVETAVRITHIPTGITATCQDERSQTQNKAMAMKILKSRLMLLEKKKQEETLKGLKGAFRSIEWGNEIRSYVLQPYKLVKDHRTGVEIGNVDEVLEGELDEFIWAYLKSKK
ncbi:peptide chain release factor 2 [Caldisericum exile]|uniref:Peptide chain release factor 2 n=1 Tax=Caldisericum exile (strain DSM 21853 / NBRC 104410 / AZM16c01) TaxID=511051 RepID=A0A7U6GF12_CALEA|nr:peptide chain release factor 2 [Caldisericum exile]BAL81181.1 peptide chain release factor 2 [Caldisericum exile AZM16c01]